MKARLLDERGGLRTYLLVFDPGDEFLRPMIEFAAERKIAGASFTGIGALSGATLAWFDPVGRQYHPVEIGEQVECVSLAGNIGRKDGKPFIHAHCVVGRRDGSTAGGHVKNLRVMPTLEVMVTETPGGIERREHATHRYLLIDLEGEPQG